MWTFFIILWMPFWLRTYASPVDCKPTTNDPFRMFEIHFKEEWFEKSNFTSSCRTVTTETNAFEEVCLTPAKIISSAIMWSNIWSNKSSVAAVIRDDYTKILNKIHENPSEARQTKNLTELFMKTKQVKVQLSQGNHLKGYSDIMLFIGLFLETMANIKTPRYFFNDTVTVDKCINRTIDNEALDFIMKEAVDNFQKRRIETYTLVQMLEENIFMKEIRPELLDIEQNSPLSNKTLVREIMRMKLMATLRAQFGYESSLNPEVQLCGDLWAITDEQIKCKIKSIPEIVLTNEGIKEYKRRVDYYLEEAKKFDEVDKQRYKLESVKIENLFVQVPEMFDEKVDDDYDDKFDHDIDEKEQERTRPLGKIIRKDEAEIKAISSLAYLVSLHDNHTDPQEKMKRFVNRFSFREDVRGILMAGFIYRLLFLTSDSTSNMKYFTKECDIYAPALFALQHFYGPELLGAVPLWDIFVNRDYIRRVKVKLEDGKIKNFNVTDLINQLEYTDKQERRLMNIKKFMDLFSQISHSAIYNDFAFIDFMKSYLNTAIGKPNRYLRCYEQSISNYDNFTESIRKESRINKVFSYVFLRMLEEGKYLKKINQGKVNKEIERLKAEYKIKEKEIEQIVLGKDSNKISEELLQIRREDLKDQIEQLQTALKTKLNFLSNTTLIQITTSKRLMEQEIQKYIYLELGTSKVDRDITTALINKLDHGIHQHLFNEVEIPYHEIMLSNEGWKEFQHRTQQLFFKKKINFSQ